MNSGAYLFTRIILVFIVAMMPNISMAISLNDKTRVNLDTTFYDESDSANAACTGQGESELDGHKLPATKGGTGLEEDINEAGQVPSGGTVTFSKFANMGQEYRDYYITMRWRYVKWNWSGDPSSPGPEKVDWYSEKPRKVLVTNPRTKKSIIAAVLEAGPAPWTGVDTASNNDPKQGWVNPQDGTPPEYKGRVSGFPTKAFNYLGAGIRMADGSGDDLLYSWAPDQDAKPGPVTTTASSGTKKTVVIGDSISVGMRDEGDLKQKLTRAGWKSTIDPSGSRSIAGAGTTDRKTSGLRAVQDNKDPEIKEANVVAIQLGTNASNSLSDFKSDVKEMVKDIREINNSATILWVNLFSQVPQKDSYNNALTELAQSEDFKLLDVSQLDLDFDRDNIHLLPSGYKKLAEKVTEGINASSSGDANCDEIGDANIIQFKPRIPTSGTIRPTAIVLHWWSTNAPGDMGIQALINGLAGNSTCSGGCSVQLGILRDGKTYQLTNSLTSRASHAFCANSYAIGIEMEGTPQNFGADGPEKRPEQFKAAVATVKYLMEKYNIPLESTIKDPSSLGAKGVVSHKEISAKCDTARGGSSDVDDAYLEKVKQAIRSGNAN